LETNQLPFTDKATTAAI